MVNGNVQDRRLLVIVDVQRDHPEAAVGEVEGDRDQEAGVERALVPVSVARADVLRREEGTFHLAGGLAVADDLDKRHEVHDDGDDESDDADEGPHGQHRADARLRWTFRHDVVTTTTTQILQDRLVNNG